METEPNAGRSKCPICKREWLVTPSDDCLVPSCGCYGENLSHDNIARPCEKCGIAHALNCDKMPN